TPAISEDALQYSLYPPPSLSDKASVTSFAVLVASRSDPQEYFLEGRMRVGDCIDDEWCTVRLPKQVSSKWDMEIRQQEAWPTWVTPSNSENRAWIYSSQLHIISLLHTSPPCRKRQRRKLPGKSDNDDEGEDDQEGFISVEDSLKVLHDESVNTLASMEPVGHLHNTGGYNHGTRPMRTLYIKFGGKLRRRSKAFLAQSLMLAIKFFPPKVFGQWKADEGSDEWRWRDVGMKIAVGFEMLFQESKGRIDPSSDRSDALQSSVRAQKDALRRNPQYIEYIQNLVSVDYFRGERADAHHWNMLEDKAAATFLDTQREDDVTCPSFASLITAAISRTSDLPFTHVYEDSDQWLYIDAKDFENMLETTMGSSKQQENAMETVASDQASRLKSLATKVKAFVEGKGDLEGATFEDEELSEDEDLSDEPLTESEESPAARQAALDKLVPKPSEYGQMPAFFHSNSQKVTPTTIETDVVEDAENIKPSATTEPHSKPIREPIIPRDRYDGVDSDHETDEEEEVDEEEDDRPQVVGDIEVDMGEEEDEFLEFFRQALGITDVQWGEILRDRKSRGAFVPSSLTVPTGPSSKETKSQKPLAPESGPRPNINLNLNSFEAAMLAMDEELARSRSSKAKPTSAKAPRPLKQDKGKGKAPSTIEEEEYIDSALDNELRAALECDEDEGEIEGEASMDYNLIKNFLESFKIQGGLSGPVSTLADRLAPGWQLPRDSS
ncbi:SGT1 protein-domain-containing protein, partial [Mycena leptocephala]